MRKALTVMMGVILVMVALGNSYAIAYTYTAVDYPGASSPLGTTANGINDAGTIVGYYRDGNGDLYRGFFLTNGTYTSLSYPGSLGTLALGINNEGTIVGYRYGTMSYDTYGFSLSGGIYTPINYPGGQSTEPRGINSTGTIIGNYWNGNSYHGFSLTGTTYTPLDYPGASNTLPRGINEAGTVVGQYWDGTGRQAFRLSGGTYASFGYPGALETDAFDINDAGTIVGIYRDGSGYHGFSLTGTTYTPLDYPGSLETSGISINSQGTIVGAYLDGSMSHGYVATLSGSCSLTATKEGTGSGSISASGLSCNENTCSGIYNCGTTITITATADTGSHFENWSGCDSTSNNLCIVSMVGNRSVNASFTLDPHTLTATKTGSGLGTLTAQGLNCIGNTCTGTYNYNETVNITATADSGSVFAGWSGCDTAIDNVCSVLINGDRNVTATFYPEYTLLVNLEGTGEGRVVSTPSGIDCEPTCSDTFSVNTPVTLRAYPYGGSAFAYWSGVCTGTATTCDVTMTSYVEVTAHFVSDETKEYKLSVGKKHTNKGDGLVQSDDGTISCGTVCTGLYYPNAPITLRATPSPGSLFEGWSPTSLNCGASPTCSFTMNSNAKVKAIFRGPYRLLTKIKSKNDGSGSVMADISGIGTGINCPASSCEDYYPYGNNVVLTAQAAGGGSQLMGWKPSSLGCGTNLTCTVPMTKKQSVTATFEGM